MRTFVPYRTCWSLLLAALAIRLRNKPTYDKLRVLIINKDVCTLLARKNGNENPIWSWNDSDMEASKRGRLVDVANLTYRTLTKRFYILHKTILAFNFNLNCFQWYHL